jgi:DNA repair protein RecN (Recombination protein N)
MIEEIYIRDIGVIAEARLELRPGLTVLTGETGAGKTMVLSALGLLLGERADTGSIRGGQPQASVEGRWLVRADGPLADRLAEAGIELDVLASGNATKQAELIMNRSLSAEGRSRAAVAGRAVPVALLSEVADYLVAVHGQADQQRLRSATAQREALDQFGGPELELVSERYATAFHTWRASAARLATLKTELGHRLREAEELRATVAELEAAALEAGEDVKLAELTERLTHLEVLQQATTSAHDLLSSEGFGESSDAISLIGQARKALEQVAHFDAALAAQTDQLREIGFQLTDVAAQISAYAGDLEGFSPSELQAMHERRALIGTLTKKYAKTLDELIAFSAEASNRLLDLDSSTEQIEQLETSVDGQLAEAQALADELTALRKSAAAELSSAVSAELSALAMGAASLVIQVTPAAELGSFGQDQIAILLSSYQGAEPRPLGKTASGGELSRIMLALEVVLAKTAQTPTFIFDEIDAGVGGAAAIEIGRRLAKLAQTAQVIVVTHLAQVAAFANHHLNVQKTASATFTASDVQVLTGEARTAELARMLSGLADSASAREHAQELLALAKN